MKKLEHIGIAVKDLSASNHLFERLLRKKPYKTEEVPSEGVRTSFFEIGGIKIELLEGITEDSPITRYIQKHGEGIHHLAFETETLEENILYYQSEGISVINEQPKNGADNKMIAFLHPKSTNGVLIELCQEIQHHD